MPKAHRVSNRAHLWRQKAFGHKVEEATTLILFLKRRLGPCYCQSKSPVRGLYNHLRLYLATLCLLVFVRWKRKTKMAKVQDIYWELKRKTALAHFSPSDTYIAFSMPLTSHLFLPFLLSRSLEEYSQKCVYSRLIHLHAHVCISGFDMQLLCSEK